MPSSTLAIAQKRYKILQIISLIFLLLLVLVPPLLVPHRSMAMIASPIPRLLLPASFTPSVTTIRGIVQSRKSKDKILQEATKAFGSTGYIAEIVVNPHSSELEIEDALAEIFADWKASSSTEQDFDSGRLVLTRKTDSKDKFNNDGQEGATK